METLLKKNGKKLFWDWEYPMKTLEDTPKKAILLIDMACLNEYKKVSKLDEKFGKY